MSSQSYLPTSLQQKIAAIFWGTFDRRLFAIVLRLSNLQMHIRPYLLILPPMSRTSCDRTDVEGLEAWDHKCGEEAIYIRFQIQTKVSHRESHCITTIIGQQIQRKFKKLKIGSTRWKWEDNCGSLNRLNHASGIRIWWKKTNINNDDNINNNDDDNDDKCRKYRWHLRCCSKTWR